ncbi:hypothetical protein D9M68_558880 [compost metagenome]
MLALVDGRGAAQVALQFGAGQRLVLRVDQAHASLLAVLHLVLRVAEHAFPATGEEHAPAFRLPVPDAVPGAIQGKAPALLAELQLDLALAQLQRTLGHQGKCVLPLVDQQQQVTGQQQGEGQPADGHQVGGGQRRPGKEGLAGHDFQQVLAIGEGHHAALLQFALRRRATLVDQLLDAIAADIADPHYQAFQVVRRDRGFHFQVQAERRHHETTQSGITHHGALVDGGQNHHATGFALRHADHVQALGHGHLAGLPRLGDGRTPRRLGVHVHSQGYVVDSRGDAVIHRKVFVPRRAGHQAVTAEVADGVVDHALGTGAGLEGPALVTGDSRHPGIGQGVPQERADEALELAKGHLIGVAEKSPDRIQLPELAVQPLLDAADTLAGGEVEALAQLRIFVTAHHLAQQQGKCRAAEDGQQTGQPHQRAAGQECRQVQFFLRKRPHAHFSDLGLEIPSL